MIDKASFFTELAPHVHGHLKHHHDYSEDPVFSRVQREFARELQPDGSIILYRNAEDGTRTDEECKRFDSYTEWVDWQIAGCID